jgi:hypothetical protein
MLPAMSGMMGMLPQMGDILSSFDPMMMLGGGAAIGGLGLLGKYLTRKKDDKGQTQIESKVLDEIFNIQFESLNELKLINEKLAKFIEDCCTDGDRNRKGRNNAEDLNRFFRVKPDAGSVLKRPLDDLAEFIDKLLDSIGYKSVIARLGLKDSQSKNEFHRGDDPLSGSVNKQLKAIEEAVKKSSNKKKVLEELVQIHRTLKKLQIKVKVSSGDGSTPKGKVSFS